MCAVRTTAKTEKVIAIACSDLHLSHTPPVARAMEPDWYAAMKRPLNELREIARHYDCPVLCAGDIFHHFKAPPELVNFALEELPDGMLCVPGQHDLSLHSWKDITKTAYWTLAKAEKIEHVEAQWCPSGDFIVNGFGWERPVTIAPDDGKSLNIALIHEFMYAGTAAYTGAPKEALVNPSRFRGFKTIIVGDNHIPWDRTFSGGINFFNCGGFMRRKIDDTHQPRVGLVMSDGSVKPHPLDTSEDVLTDVGGSDTVELIGLENFFEEIRDLNEVVLDFHDTLRTMLKKKKLSPMVRELIEAAMESGVK